MNCTPSSQGQNRYPHSLRQLRWYYYPNSKLVIGISALPPRMLRPQDARVSACSPPPPQGLPSIFPRRITGHRLHVDRVHISCKIILLGARVERGMSDCLRLDFLHIYLPDFGSMGECRQHQVLSECTTDSGKSHLPFLCLGFNFKKIAKFALSKRFGDFQGSGGGGGGGCF